MTMTKEEKLNKITQLKIKADQLKRESDYYNALQLALKLILNGSYGAFATQYFILFNQHVAGTITAQGRDLTKSMKDFLQEFLDKVFFFVHHFVSLIIYYIKIMQTKKNEHIINHETFIIKSLTIDR